MSDQTIITHNEGNTTRAANRRYDTRMLLALAVALFAAASVVHIVCGDFPKALDVLPDERRYLEIARSLFAGGDLIIRGADSNFQKILYPVSLFPALLFPDGEMQIRMVNVLNSLYACSIVFPVLLIARRIFEDPRIVAVCLLLAVIAPDLMYSMTFMSESVFMPLSLWLFYLCWRCFESVGWREIALAAASGALCYIAYLCKEVALSYLIAFVLFYLVAAIRKRRTWKQSIICIVASAGFFIVLFYAFKLTLFAGMSNSYSQFGPEPLMSLYALCFGFYAILQDGVYFIVGFGVFPVIYLAITYRKVPRDLRDLLFFCFVSLAVGLAVVVFTISMREDVGHVALRPHLRYVAPIAVVLLMLFLKQVAHFDASVITSSPRRIAIVAGITAAFCALVLVLFGSGNLQQGFDFSQFHFMRWLLRLPEQLAPEYYDSGAQELRPISADDGALLDIDPLNWMCRLAVIAFTLVGMWALMHRDHQVRVKAGVAICGIIALFMVANSVTMGIYNRNAYEVDPENISQMCEISDFLAQTEGQEVVVVLDEDNTGPNNMVDTYLQDGTGRYIYKRIDYFQETFSNSDMGRGESGYLLVNNEQDVSAALNSVHAKAVIGDPNDSQFTLYQLGWNAVPVDIIAQ